MFCNDLLGNIFNLYHWRCFNPSHRGYKWNMTCWNYQFSDRLVHFDIKVIFLFLSIYWLRFVLGSKILVDDSVENSYNTISSGTSILGYRNPWFTSRGFRARFELLGELYENGTICVRPTYSPKQSQMKFSMVPLSLKLQI